MKLNPDFKTMLIENFGEEQYENILKAYSMEPVRGIRLNPDKPIKIKFDYNTSILNPEMLIPKDYAKTVTHPFHHAGCYYIQDPSASTPVLALDLVATDIVLDMCAAPGGKSTYILSKISKGFLLANEIDSRRNQKLVHNLQRWGCENVVVVQNKTNMIAKHHPNTFDKVLLDAPCSGEGLYRKDKDFALKYNKNTAYEFANLQSELLEDAYSCVKDGGIIVYSTCTLNTIENEGVVQSFLEKHPNCLLESISLNEGYPGLNGLTKAVRFFPNEHGEGHFIAKIRVSKNVETNNLIFDSDDHERVVLENIPFEAVFRKKSDALYGLKNRGFLKSKLNITMDGTLFGYYKKSHFDFDHSLSIASAFYNDLNHVEVSETDAYLYLNGQQISSTQKGIFCVNYEGNSLGFAKGNGNMANNRYPKGLRNHFVTYNKN